MLAVAATDGRFYYEVTDCVYRFTYIHFTNDDLPRIHGINERISLEDIFDSTKFYARVILNAQFDGSVFNNSSDDNKVEL